MPTATKSSSTTAHDGFAQRLAELQNRANGHDNAGATAASDRSEETESDRESQAQPLGAGDYVVQSGDCISSIARESGHFWQTLWDDAANAELKTGRRQPNVLMSGDRVTIPELRPKQESGESEMRHRFRRRGEPSHLAIRVLDQDVPRANEPFKLILDGGEQTIDGVTDAEGKLDVPIPGSAQKGKLTVGVEPDVLEYDLDLGGLEPVETWKGVQTRLANLGIACDVTEEKDEQTMDAVNEFREQQGLPASDELDDATRAKLQEKHGS